MTGQGLPRILSALIAGQEAWSSDQLCAMCPEVAGVSGAGVMLMAGDMPGGSLCASDEVSQLIEDLQYTLGEGPCVDAHQSGAFVSEPDLAEPVTSRWPAFTPPALRGGVRAVFGFPLQVGTIRLGALNLYRVMPGPLTSDQQADALMVADITAHWVLNAQSAAPANTVAVELEANADFHFSVHNAAGIVSIQENISVDEALIRLRAFAFSNDLPISEVARNVIARKLRLR